MKKTLLLCAAASLFALTACESWPTSLPPGEYKQTEKTSSKYGTTEETTRTKVYYDQSGNKRAIQETETSQDPPGLFNKSKTTTTRTYN